MGTSGHPLHGLDKLVGKCTLFTDFEEGLCGATCLRRSGRSHQQKRIGSAYIGASHPSTASTVRSRSGSLSSIPWSTTLVEWGHGRWHYHQLCLECDRPRAKSACTSRACTCGSAWLPLACSGTDSGWEMSWMASDQYYLKPTPHGSALFGCQHYFRQPQRPTTTTRGT